MAIVTIIPPTAQVPTVGTGQQAGSATEAGTPAPTLHLGSTVSGTIVGKDTGGNFLLRTNQGTLTLHSNTPLTYNSDVTIRIDASNSGGTSARIITVNGEPFASFSAPTPQEGDSVSPALLTPTQTTTGTPAPATAAAPVPLAPEAPVNALNAVVVSPASAQQAQTADSGEANNPVANGTNVVIRVTATPQQTTQQTSSTTVTAPPTPRDSGTPAAPAAVQTQTAAQEIAQEQTPATVGKLTAPQQANIQQNAPSPAPAGAQTPAEFADAFSQPQTPQAQPATPANALYAAYAKQSPSSPQTSPTSQAPTTTVQGQVIGTNADGTVAVKTPLGTVTVQTPPTASGAPAPLAVGANVSVELPTSAITQPPASVSILTPQATTPAALPELATSWTTLKDILTLIAATDPDATPGTTAAASSASPAASALLARLPQLGPDFAASSLSFISAINQGDARKLLGNDTIDTLRKNGRADLVDKFSGELDNLSEAMNAPAQRQTPAWQTVFLPFVYQEELQQARLYVKRDAPKKEKTAGAQSKGDTRFIVEVDLSELGPMQMDGLIRDKQKSTVFDLVIRSHTPFTREDQAAITDIYNSAAQLTGFSGNVGFQVTRDFPVKPLEEAAAGDHSITV